MYTLSEGLGILREGPFFPPQPPFLSAAESIGGGLVRRGKLYTLGTRSSADPARGCLPIGVGKCLQEFINHLPDCVPRPILSEAMIRSIRGKLSGALRSNTLRPNDWLASALTSQ